jgi:tRNA 2-selenouridine synthase
LTELKGKAVVNAWQAQLDSGQLELVVRDLLVGHYDPTYAKSVARNFLKFPQATAAPLGDRHAHSMLSLAQTLVKQFA